MPRAIIDALSGRQVLAGDEEQNATQPLIFYLTQRLGWNPTQLITRPQWRVPTAPSAARAQGYPVDIAIFDSPEHRGDPDHIRIIAECKAPSEDSGIGQLKTYLNLEPEARLGIWFNGLRHALVYKTPSGFEVNHYGPIPRPSDPLTPSASQPPIRFGDLIPPPNLGETFSRLRDHIAAQDTHINRDEFILNDLANLLICKIRDEQLGEMDPQRPMAFQLAGTRAATASAIRALFDETKTHLRSVFTDDRDRLHVDEASLETIVKTLQPYQLLGHDRHAVGAAFQVLRGRALKGEEGAYFTPPPLVDCVVSILDPRHTERVIDPACGTGGFLAAALDHVYEVVDNTPDVSDDAKRDAKRDWARDSLVAVDKDAVSVRLCKAYLTLLGDGRSHAYRANAIDRSDWPARPDNLVSVVATGSFDVVMTNPPFGKKLTVDAEVGRREGLLSCRRWRPNAGQAEATDEAVEQQLGAVFFERAVELLKPGGRLAIVLPETFLFSPNFRWFVDWICRTLTVTHVVDVPMVAFEEYCRAKTCLLFVTNRTPAPGQQIVMSFPKTIGLDRDAKPVYKRDASGKPTADLDNEMAEAVKEIVGAAYDGTGRSKRRTDLVEPTRFRFLVPQAEVRARAVLVPRYWWRRDTDHALGAWIERHPSDIVTLGELVDEQALEVFQGHGTPSGGLRGTGDVPYVKVTDLKNWRINENPTNLVHRDIAARLRRNRELRYGDLLTPSRASKNIGQFCMVLPWQTHVVLTKEILGLRVLDNSRGLDPFLLLALLSLRVVVDQYENLVLMQVNREHLGSSWREVRVPIPKTAAARQQLAGPVRSYFEGIVQARVSYDTLMHTFEPADFGTRP